MQEMQASIFQQFTVTKRGFRESILKTGSARKMFRKISDAFGNRFC